MREWVRNEYLLPYLVIGGDENRFWSLTPKTIQLYFDAHAKRMELEEQKMWMMGQYIRLAISSVVGYTVSIPLLDDKSAKSHFKPQEYPPQPSSKTEEVVHDEKWLENENKKFMAWITSIKPLD